MTRRFRPVVPALAVAAVSALLLAGCASAGAATGLGAKASAPPASPSLSATSDPPSSAAPTVNPTDAINATTVLPDDFPPVIPLIEGDIFTSSSTSTGWVVWISSSDPISGYQEASSSLEDAGFTATADQSINGSAGGVFTSDQYTVTVSAGSDAKYQNAVGYQVDKK